ncbi:hypothetical protein AV530_012032 [Patagioenas fasciata monilis]|uniref:Uncharacterized protein n=1 Tax=Patagioenas fasciata monilis TaxID=372326 RepID=A0A1V4JUL3_PATFA|nr:hypothetical protein AV530_012032 [Patagioenas fasciata monilis]
MAKRSNMREDKFVDMLEDSSVPNCDKYGRQRAGARRPGGAAGPGRRRSRSRELRPTLPEERRRDIVYGAASPERGVKLCTCSPHAS